MCELFKVSQYNCIYICMHLSNGSLDTWQGWIRVSVLPIPSTVVTANPCIEHNGAKHAFTE